MTHSTFVAGITKGNSSSFPGIASGAALYAAGRCPGGADWSQLQAETDEALTWGAQAVNYSWGGAQEGLSDISRYMDDVVQHMWRGMVGASGNDGATLYVNDAAQGYNVIGVSCFDDNDTDFVSSDDLMPSSQQGGELASIHGDRVKPEVAAPGCGINSTTTASPWISVWGGSSFAAPMVLGMHALLTEADPNMTWWPEVVKAITIATATHEVVESPSGALIKPQSGTGGISIGNAISVARGIHGGWAADYIN
jgi:hypothetical protein